jgi:hypothetical protein
VTTAAWGFSGRDLGSDAALDPLFELGDDLLVGRREDRWRRRRRGSPAASLDTLDDVGQLLDRAQIGRCRFVDELLDHQLALGDPAPGSVLGDLDLLVERLAQQGREVLRAFRAAVRVAGPAFLEPGMARRLAIADRVIAGRLGIGIRWNFRPRLLARKRMFVN